MSTEVELTVNTIPIPLTVENEIIKSIDTSAPNIYGKLPSKQAEEIANKFNLPQSTIYSIRSAYVKNKMVKRHHKLEYKSKNIYHNYKKGMGVLELSKHYDGSPLNIMRIIFRKKYPYSSFKELVEMLPKTEQLSAQDAEQLQIAIDNDIFAIVNGTQQLKHSVEFEDKIEEFLVDNHIKFKTQNELVEIQTKKYGKPISTPDFLIESSFYINGVKINWIDAKNFYGSSVPFIHQNIERQIEKYLKNYGSGCLIFSLGYSEGLNVGKDVLLFGYDDLKKNE